MTALYITADKIGLPTGGGQVTYHELQALRQLTEVTPISIDHDKPAADPFTQDDQIMNAVQAFVAQSGPPKLAHCYAGCLTETVRYLRSVGCKVVYTAAAHDIEVSRHEHESLGFGYDYPHLTQPDLLDRYLGGYREADVVICPSSYSERVMRRFGCDQVVVIPHGHTPYTGEFKPYPRRFVVGYLGAVGPDKGLMYLLQAWKKLNYSDATLILAGRYMMTGGMLAFINQFGGGNIQVKGWVENIADFYNSLSCYVQPSVSEGFGCEVLEAMAHGRPVICSQGAGAVDLVPVGWSCKARDVDELARVIDVAKGIDQLIREGDDQRAAQKRWMDIADRYTWEKVYLLYQATWRKLCGEITPH